VKNSFLQNIPACFWDVQYNVLIWYSRQVQFRNASPYVQSVGFALLAWILISFLWRRCILWKLTEFCERMNRNRYMKYILTLSVPERTVSWFWTLSIPYYFIRPRYLNLKLFTLLLSVHFFCQSLWHIGGGREEEDHSYVVFILLSLSKIYTTCGFCGGDSYCGLLGIMSWRWSIVFLWIVCPSGWWHLLVC
jgi:hypothetical protein